MRMKARRRWAQQQRNDQWPIAAGVTPDWIIDELHGEHGGKEPERRHDDIRPTRQELPQGSQPIDRHFLRAHHGAPDKEPQCIEEDEKSGVGNQDLFGAMTQKCPEILFL